MFILCISGVNACDKGSEGRAGGWTSQQQNPALANLPFSARYQEIQKKRLRLPVWEHGELSADVLVWNRSLVLVGAAGSGRPHR